MPVFTSKRDYEYQKRKKRKHFRKRAAIELILGLLKQGHSAVRNYLKGQSGDSINFIMAAAGVNYRKLIKKFKNAFYAIPLNLKLTLLIYCYHRKNIALF